MVLNNRDFEPTAVWWVVLLSLIRVVAEIPILSKTLHHFALLATKQETAFYIFIHCLLEITGIQEPIFKSHIQENDQAIYVCHGFYTIAKDAIAHFVYGSSSFVASSFDGLLVEQKIFVVYSVRNFLVSFAAGIRAIESEWDGSNELAAS